jgi:hypothetical protein
MLHFIALLFKLNGFCFSIRRQVSFERLLDVHGVSDANDSEDFELLLGHAGQLEAVNVVVDEGRLVLRHEERVQPITDVDHGPTNQRFCPELPLSSVVHHLK